MARSERLRWAARLVGVVWLISVALTVLAVPLRLRALSIPCVGPACADDNSLLAPDAAAALQRLGLSLPQYALYQVGVALFQTALSWLLALVLLRRPPELMTLLAALALAAGGFFGFLLNALPPAVPVLALPANAILYIGYIAFILVFYLFPDGRFVPRWTFWLALALALDEFVYTFLPDSPMRRQAWYSALDGVIWLTTFFAVAATQLYRYRFVSTPVQKVQTRWVVFGVSLSLLAVLALLLVGLIFGLSANPYYRVAFGLLLPWATVLAPLTLGLSILRYRLWDIDVIIRRTLVYSALTALLALVYLGSVVLLQALFTAVTGQSRSDLVTVLSTLAIAAVFVPLRRRVQAAIDRRFYRRRYDAARILAQFGLTLRDEVDLDELTRRLLTVVDETMQPASADLWLAPPQR
jgi:hypothetical protein